MIRATKDLVRGIRRISFVPLTFVAILYLTQDVQIFPSILRPSVQGDSLPANTKELIHTSTDGTSLKVWRMQAANQSSKFANYRALILHGNGGHLEHFVAVQRWMSELGITNYSFDYRGTGGSHGWPSEAGIFLDTMSVYQRMLKDEQVAPENTIIVGISIGSGFAAGLAAQVEPKALVLFSPYKSIPALARERILTRYLTPLLRYTVSTEDFLQQLSTTCLLVVHGIEDTIIPIAHSDDLSTQWSSEGFRWYRRFSNTGHNELFFVAAKECATALGNCLQYDQ